MKPPNDRRHEQTGQIAETERLYLVNIYRTQHLTKRVSSTGAGVVSLMDGAVMGSGTLFGLNSNWSVVTERSVWGIPEVSKDHYNDGGERDRGGCRLFRSLSYHKKRLQVTSHYTSRMTIVSSSKEPKWILLC